jgi:glutamyl endopeptidase
MRKTFTTGMMAFLAALAILMVGAMPGNAAPLQHAVRPRAGDESKLANPGKWKASPGKKVTVPMDAVHVTKLISKYPDSRGSLEVQLANGRTAEIPASAKDVVMKRSVLESQKLSPDTVIVGNCGTSQVDLGVKDNDHPVRMTTGFTVDTPALEYGWTVNITGPNYSYQYSAAGFLAAESSWSGSHDSDDDYTAGDYTATVDTGSYATLANGTVCYSGGPVADVALASPDTPIEHDAWQDGATPGSAKEPTTLQNGSPVAGALRARATTADPSAAATGWTDVAQVPDTTAYPNSAVAYLTINWPDGKTTQCTGFLYDTGMVATAGHCLYSTLHGGWETRVYTTPGINQDGAPFPGCLPINAYSSTGWVQNGDLNYDYGAISLDCTVGDETGGFGREWPDHQNDSPPTTLTSAGYTSRLTPARAQWTGTSSLIDYNQRTFRYNVQSYDGMSGGPVYEISDGDVYAVGIQSQGYDLNQGPSTAVRFTQANEADYEAWDRGEIFP